MTLLRPNKAEHYKSINKYKLLITTTIIIIIIIIKIISLTIMIVPLTNRVRRPYCKLRPASFPIDLWPKCEARRP